jgi:tripartite-type tricarboxylate transporter receptor subunit TctC
MSRSYCIAVLTLAAAAEPVALALANPDALLALVKSEVDKWGPIIRKAGVYAD